MKRVLPFLGWLVALAPLVLTFTTDDSSAQVRMLRQLSAFLLGYAVPRVCAELWVLLTGRWGGKRKLSVVLGTGRVVAATTVGGTQVELRAFPTAVHIYWTIAHGRLVRLRLWLSAVLLTAGPAALAWWLWTSGVPMAAWGIVLGLAGRIVRGFRDPYCFGSQLLRLPFRPSSVVSCSEAGHLATAALLQGRFGAAAAVVDRMEPASNPGITRAKLALGAGRYAEAEERARTELAAQHHPSLMVEVGLVLTSAIAGAGDSGELPPATALPRLLAAVDLFDGDPASLRVSVPALIDLARWEGRPDDAVAIGLAQRGLHRSRIWRAESSCALAAALGAAGRPEEAGAALVRARKECPELARVALVERQLARWAAALPVEVHPV
ncbi:hypothetical protein ACFCX4_10280 [Kitasatospora sp. NPDC056327]|uniref:hypothetical protein n=1 Tax=Kitasatospora sp. NPDC056327 TaxID=3345785 RepID=UPI0035DD6EB6